MTNIAIVYHSGYGHTEKQAKHVEKGAASVEGVTTHLYKVEEIKDNLSILDSADAIIFGSPTYMGSLSAAFKAFMEASSKVWSQHGWKDKVAAGFTNSYSLDGDKHNSLVQLSVFAAQHAMIWVSLGQLNQSPDGHAGNADAINRVGSSLGAVAQSENDSPEVTPPAGDLKTAELLGKRVADITKRLNK